MVKNLLIAVGPGFHTPVRILHAMVKAKSDSKVLKFDIQKKADLIGDDLRCHYSIEYKDYKETFNVLGNWLADQQFDLVGVSFMSHHWDIFIEIIKVIRRELPKCKIVAGGVHAWHIDPLGTLKFVDYVCAGEGEELYSSLIDVISSEKHDQILRIPGLIEKHGDEIIRTPATEYMPVDDLPVPSVGSNQIFGLTAIGQDSPKFVDYDPDLSSPELSIHAGRGCSFKCTFCINSVMDNPSVKLRSVDKVIEEINTLRLAFNDVKAIYFYDEIFPVRSKWLKEFAEKYRVSVGLPFQITLYPGMLNDEKLEMLREAGLKEISMGLQSGSERVRKHVFERNDKNSRLTEENVILAKQNAMVYYDIIIRNPYETKEDLDALLDLVNGLRRPFYLKFYTLAFYPHHPLTVRAVAEEMIRPEDVDATIGYLDVTTPHKVVMSDHFWHEDTLALWHERVRKRFFSGSIEDGYYLLTSYYGYWFIPRSVLQLLYLNFKKKRYWVIKAFSLLITVVLKVRNLSVFHQFHRVSHSIKNRGWISTTRLLWGRVAERVGPAQGIPVRSGS